MNALKSILNSKFILKVKEFVFKTFLSLSLSLLVIFQIDASCVLTCHKNLNLPFNNSECVITIQPDYLLLNPASCPETKVVTAYDADNNIIDADPGTPGTQIPSQYVGQSLRIVITPAGDNKSNFCETYVTFSDEQAPDIYSCYTMNINCLQNPAPVSEGGDVGLPLVNECSEYVSNYEDDIVDYTCGEHAYLSAVIYRNWTFTDVNGNSSSCIQPINIYRVNIEQAIVKCPKEITVSCAFFSQIDMSPEQLGYPEVYIDGSYVSLNPTVSYCEAAVTYYDTEVENCGGSKTLKRTWVIEDWCTEAPAFFCIQKINVIDEDAPVIGTLNDIEVKTDDYKCTADVVIPESMVSDECSDVEVEIYSSFGTIYNNGGLVKDVPVGTHTFTLKATDECNNMISKDFEITVVDEMKPVAICDQHTVVVLQDNGAVKVMASSFDDGSYDNCGDVTFEVRRMETVCGDETEFGPYAQFFCCEAKSGPVMVVFRVTDQYGNASECMVEVTVQDKNPPLLICPDFTVVNCDVDLDDLDLTGRPTYSDACGITRHEYVDTKYLNECGLGYVERKWTVEDINGLISECTQVITVENTDPLESKDVDWPEDITLTSCETALEPDDLPEGSQRPIFTTNTCELYSVSHMDEVLEVNGKSCVQINRKWTLKDICRFDPEFPDRAVIEYNQIIRVIDTEDPIFTNCPKDLEFSSTDLKCEGGAVEITVYAEDCTKNLIYTYKVDLNNDESVDFDGEGNVLSEYLPVGNHSVVFTATDGCNNFSECIVLFSVVDRKQPTPVCKVLAVDLMPLAEESMIELTAEMFNASSFDNCDSSEELKYSFSEDMNDNMRRFTCADIGTQSVAIYVFDSSGNSDYCTTLVDIQDNNKACPTDTEEVMAQVSGHIFTPSGEEIENVQVQLIGNAATSTDASGLYNFVSLPRGNGYTIMPSKDLNDMNGISTYDIVILQRHVLGIKNFTSPYDYLAADVNGSGGISTSDMVEIRRLILGVKDEFSNVDSWSFIDANYQFDQPTNPFSANLPEGYVINDLADNMTVDFVGIKLGDLNASVDPTNILGDKAFNEPIILEIENQLLKAGERYTIPVKVKSFDNIVGLQYTMEVDPNAATLISLTGEMPQYDDNNFGTQYLSSGMISSSWTNIEGLTLEDGDIMMTIEIVANQDVYIEDVIALTSEITDTEAYGIEGKRDVVKDIELTFDDVLENEFLVSQNNPNPFSDNTSIAFTLPEAANVHLEILDITGKVIYKESEYYANGFNEIKIGKSQLNASGIFYYRISNGKTAITKKMVVLQ